MNTEEKVTQILDEEGPVKNQFTEMAKREQEEGLWAWVKEHKKPIICTAIGITAVLGIICGIRNKKMAEELFAVSEVAVKRESRNITGPIPAAQLITPAAEELLESKRPYTKPTESFDVTGHIREMAEWKHHSEAKAAQAAALGIALKPNQTIVDSYPKYAA